jgi:hypothetical protein
MAFDDLRDLRESAREDEEAYLPYEDDEAAVTSIERSTLFLGMTAIERMFLSIFLFMNVTVIGLALLLATGRIG